MTTLNREDHPAGARLLTKWNVNAPLVESVVVEWSRKGYVRLCTSGITEWRSEAQFPEVVELLDRPLDR